MVELLLIQSRASASQLMEITISRNPHVRCSTRIKPTATRRLDYLRYSTDLHTGDTVILRRERLIFQEYLCGFPCKGSTTFRKL